MNIPGYDSWLTGPFGRFERQQERKDAAYVEALSERDHELRNDAMELSEAFADAIDDPTIEERFAAILQAAATHKPPREIGAALTRLVQEIIEVDSRRSAEEVTQ